MTEQSTQKEMQAYTGGIRLVMDGYNKGPINEEDNNLR